MPRKEIPIGEMIESFKSQTDAFRSVLTELREALHSSASVEDLKPVFTSCQNFLADLQVFIYEVNYLREQLTDIKNAQNYGVYGNTIKKLNLQLKDSYWTLQQIIKLAVPLITSLQFRIAQGF